MNYRLEFNEAQQCFHLDTKASRENSHGWWTVMHSCSDQMYWELLCMLETLHEKPYNRKKILDAQAKLAIFQARLCHNRMAIVFEENLSTPKSITGSGPADSVTGINQDGNPERVDFSKHPFLDVVKKSQHYIADGILYLSLKADTFHKIVNSFESEYFVIPKNCDDENTPHTAP